MAAREPIAQTFATLGVWDDNAPPTPQNDDDNEPEPYNVDPRPATEESIALDARIAELEAQLAAAKLAKAQHLGARALITRLPSEILARVFELGVHEELNLLPSLHLVSRLWRETALATPTLWSYVKLDDSWGYGHVPTFVTHAEMLLRRSGAAKLHVFLDLRYVDDLAGLEQIMVTLAPHLHRCFIFRASVPDWEWLALVHKHSTLLGPALEEFYMRLEPSDAEDVRPAPFLREQEYPLLRTITLEHAPLLTIRPARFPALRSFTLTRDQRYHSSTRMGLPLSDLLSFLGTHPGLERLRVQGVRFQLDAHEAVFSPRPVHTIVPALQTLMLVHMEPTGISTLLSATSLPSLRRLALYMDYSDESDLSFLAGLTPTPKIACDRFPALSELDLRNVNIDGPALFPFIRTLRALPRLRALGVCNPPNGAVSPKLFDLLARPYEGFANPGEDPELASNWLLPNLRALSFNNCRDISGHEIFRVARARNGALPTPPPADAPAPAPAPVPAAPEHAEGAAEPAVPVAARPPPPQPPAPLPVPLEVTRPEDRVAPLQFVRLVQCFSVDGQMAESLKGQIEVFQNY
jgi:hypothetical protein